jgi:transposase-like protein
MMSKKDPNGHKPNNKHCVVSLVAPPEGGGGERSEPEPPGGGATSEPAASGPPKRSKTERPDPEVVPQAKRRRFSAKYKLKILQEADRCTARGELGALLRREGLYFSQLNAWRQKREDGTLQGLSPKKRGPKPDPDKALAKRIGQLERENQRLAEKLEKAELIIDVQKKLSRLLGVEQPAETGKK